MKNFKTVWAAAGKIILAAAEIADDYPDLLTEVITFIACVLTAKSWISANNGETALGLILLVFIILRPILRIIIFVLVLGLKLICHAGLLIYYFLDYFVEAQNSDETEQPRDRDETEDALRYFGLSMPFTEAELKSKYREAMKRAHPDAGGSNEEASRINRYYALLRAQCV